MEMAGPLLAVLGRPSSGCWPASAWDEASCGCGCGCGCGAGAAVSLGPAAAAIAAALAVVAATSAAGSGRPGASLRWLSADIFTRDSGRSGEMKSEGRAEAQTEEPQ